MNTNFRIRRNCTNTHEMTGRMISIISIGEIVCVNDKTKWQQPKLLLLLHTNETIITTNSVIHSNNNNTKNENTFVSLVSRSVAAGHRLRFISCVCHSLGCSGREKVFR